MTNNGSASEVKRKQSSASSRLSAVLNQLHTNQSQASVADTLAAVLGIKDSDSNRAFLLAYTAITHMLEASQKEVETYLQDAFWLAAFPPLRGVFTPKNSAAQWNNYKSNLREREVTLVGAIAQSMSKLTPEVEPTDDDKKGILDAIEEMQKSLDEEPLSKYTRDTLQACLNDIRRAVEEFRIWGTPGIDHAFKFFIGTVATDQRVNEEIESSSPQVKKAWSDRVRNVFEVVKSFLSLSHQFREFLGDYHLPEAVQFLLSSHTNHHK